MNHIICDSDMEPTSLTERLKRSSDKISAALDGMLPEAGGPEADLHAAMRYAALSGGKRMRPFLVMETGALLNADDACCLRAGAALECVHAYSLIHDDLPAMDDAAERRGSPSVHVKYGQACAILAGDSLLTIAFAILAAEQTHADPLIRCRLVEATARAAGTQGMTAGQMIDIAHRTGENRAQDRTASMIRMARMKTGALICLACEMAVILADASAAHCQALAGYTHDLGLAYQIVDDLADTAEDGDVNFASILGRATAEERIGMLAAQAREHLAVFGSRAGTLRQFVDHVCRGTGQP